MDEVADVALLEDASFFLLKFGDGDVDIFGLEEGAWGDRGAFDDLIEVVISAIVILVILRLLIPGFHAGLIHLKVLIDLGSSSLSFLFFLWFLFLLLGHHLLKLSDYLFQFWEGPVV